MSQKVRIQDDLYEYVNAEKVKKLKIPEDMPMAGGFAELMEEVDRVLMKEFSHLARSKEKLDPNMEKAIRLYSLAKNVKRKNKDGIKPMLKDLKLIQSTTDIALLNRRFKTFVLKGIPLPLSLSIDIDMKDSNKYCFSILGPSTILPDTTMYNPQNPQKDMLLNMWKGLALQVLSFTDLNDDEKNQYVQDTLEFDAKIATLVKSSEEWSDYTKAYNPTSLRTVSGLLKPIGFRSALKKVFKEIPETIIVQEPRFLKGFKTLFNEETYAKYLHWAYVMMIFRNGSFLSEDLRVLTGSFSRALSGIAKETEVKKFAYQVASSAFSEPVGLYYGRKYFGEEAKKDVIEMVHEIIDAYKERIANNDILTKETKEKAILKLDTMKVKMGYPDKVDAIYDKYEVKPRESLYQVVSNLRATGLLDKCEKLYLPVDKKKWYMPGHMVNASYNPSNNDITFPAAILQKPFYSVKQSRSENLGGIGAVIGHEISHAFDNNGAKFDENGNLCNWWTKEDFKKFEKKTEAMVAQFEGIELPWGKVNSKLIVSENIADNGGLAVALHVMKHTKGHDYEAFFKNWAKIWCMKASEQYLSLLLTVDVHGPNVLRTNMPPRNFEEWYETFDVKESDKMYIPKDKRVVIW